MKKPYMRPFIVCEHTKILYYFMKNGSLTEGGGGSGGSALANRRWDELTDEELADLEDDAAFVSSCMEENANTYSLW